MTDTGADMRTITLEKGLATFLNALSGKNRSAATIRAYSTDIAQFISFLHANNVSIHTPVEVEKIDVMEYLSSLAKRGYPLKAGQLTYDCRYSTMHRMPVTGGRGFRSLKPLWYNSVPP
jgi:site-specific recombinase XerD